MGREKRTYELSCITNTMALSFQMINPFQELLVNSVLFLDISLAKLLWHYDPDNSLSNTLLVLTLLNGLKDNAKNVAKFATDDLENAQR